MRTFILITFTSFGVFFILMGEACEANPVCLPVNGALFDPWLWKPLGVLVILLGLAFVWALSKVSKRQGK